MLPLVQSARLCLIDDVISSGASICAGLDLLKLAGIVPSVAGAAMLQTQRWVQRLSKSQNRSVARIIGAFETPLLVQAEGGWQISATPND